MPDPRYESVYTGQQVESAIAKALQLDDFAHVSDEIIGSSVYHVLWKVKPTSSNSVTGFTVDPNDGKILQVFSVNGTLTVYSYITDNDTISNATIDSLFS